DGGRGWIVAQIIDKDLAAPFGNGNTREITLRRLLRHQLANPLCETLHIRPRIPPRNRHDDVQPLAASGFQEGGEAQFFEKGTKFLRRLYHLAEREPLA